MFEIKNLSISGSICYTRCLWIWIQLLIIGKRLILDRKAHLSTRLKLIKLMEAHTGFLKKRFFFLENLAAENDPQKSTF